MTKKLINDFNTDAFKLKLKEIINDETIFVSFIKDLFLNYDNKNLVYIVFSTKNEWKFMMKNYEKEIDTSIKHVFGIIVKYKTTYKEEFKDFIGNKIEENNIRNFTSNLIVRYKWSNYVEGKFNKSIITLGKKILIQEQVKFNPIFIHSSSGMGKTHFLNAIGNELITKNKSVHYLSSDSFLKKTTHLLMNSETEKINELVEYYNSFDVLLFDDVQLLGSKTSTLNVLFSILNNYIDQNKQIIIAADKHPNLLGGFEERFITRFQGGITEEIKQPTLEDLIKIFNTKLEFNHFNLKDWEDEAIKFIVRNHSASIRNLEGAINKIDLCTDIESSNIKYTYQVVSQIFNQFNANKIDNITPDYIVDIVSKYYRIPKQDILGPSRKKEIILARHISMWLIRNTINLTYKEIGNFFKGKDHSTVMSSIDKIDYQMKINETVKNALKTIKNRINSA